MSREIMQQALHHLVALADDLRRIPNDISQTIESLKAELAKPERECDLHECRRKVREADDDIKRKFRGEK